MSFTRVTTVVEHPEEGDEDQTYCVWSNDPRSTFESQSFKTLVEARKEAEARTAYFVAYGYAAKIDEVS